MPLYIYTCSKCDKLYELMIKLKDSDKKVECPKCGEEMKRVMTPVPFKIN